MYTYSDGDTPTSAYAVPAARHERSAVSVLTSINVFFIQFTSAMFPAPTFANRWGNIAIYKVGPTFIRSGLN